MHCDFFCAFTSSAFGLSSLPLFTGHRRDVELDSDQGNLPWPDLGYFALDHLLLPLDSLGEFPRRPLPVPSTFSTAHLQSWRWSRRAWRLIDFFGSGRWERSLGWSILSWCSLWRACGRLTYSSRRASSFRRIRVSSSGRPLTGGAIPWLCWWWSSWACGPSSDWAFDAHSLWSWAWRWTLPPRLASASVHRGLRFGTTWVGSKNYVEYVRGKGGVVEGGDGIFYVSVGSVG